MHQHLTSRDKSKSPQRALTQSLATEAGLNPAQCHVAIELFSHHLSDYYSEVRGPGVIVHTAVAASEPAGKPIKFCKVVPVRLTVLHEGDIDVQRERGTVKARMIKLFRLCREAREQGGLLSQEDLSLLLTVDTSTIKDLVRRLRAEGLWPATRGAIKDIGPEPSHKREVASLLGRGYSTSQVRAATNHSEGAIGRYQMQFGRVLYLLYRWPEASTDELLQLSGLTPKAFDVYAELARQLGERDDCRGHLERVRRLYELDPEKVAGQIPPGKRPADLARKRLEQHDLDTAMRQTIQEDLGTTRRVAETVTEDLRKLVDDTFVLSERVRPGEVTIFVDAHEPSMLSGQRVTDRKVIVVSVPLLTEQALDIWHNDEPISRRRARIATLLATAVQEQGGVTTVAVLAQLLHVRPETMSADLRKLAVELHVQAPTKGLLEDAGPTLTHKDWIVGLDQLGMTGAQISWLTRHAPASRDRYIETFRRATIVTRLLGRLPTAEELAHELRLRPHVAEQYLELLQGHCGEGKPSQRSAGRANATTTPASTAASAAA